MFTDFRKIAEYGVFNTPAVVVNGTVKSAGKIPRRSSPGSLQRSINRSVPVQIREARYANAQKDGRATTFRGRCQDQRSRPL
ncbi:MAG: thioredoxin family protein, partial [Syntrophales bacterium]